MESDMNLEEDLQGLGYENLAFFKTEEPVTVDIEVDSAELLSVKSDETGPAPDEEAEVSAKHCATKKTSEKLTSEEYSKARSVENEEFIASGLHAIESLAPFSLKRVYGRLESVPVINLTGIYNNHIIYASSNVVIVYDYVENFQKCLQGHRNTITCLQMETKGRFIVSTDAGKRSLIIVWETMTGKSLKYFPNAHGGVGSIFACFTGMDYIFASIGAEEIGKQTISFWDYDPKDTEKTPTTTETFPKTTSIIRELTFLDSRPEFFAATGDRNIVFGTLVRDKKSESVFLHKPRLRTTFIAKYKRFSSSVWMKGGEWLATATGAGYVVVWGPPVVLALEDPPDPSKNIREFQRSFKLCENGISVFQIYKEYVVIGDETGIARFFDHEFKLLKWCRNFQSNAILTISFNRNEEIPEFKKHFRHKFNTGDTHYPTKEKNSRVRDYTRGGVNFRYASKTTLPRPPMPCPDFVFGVTGGDIYYYHFHEGQLDRLVPGSPGPFVSCDACPGSNDVAFTTAKGDVQVYDYTSHLLIFNGRVFAPNNRITTMKFHPFGQICAFGLHEGRISFRWNYTWKTSMPPVVISPDPIVRIIFSNDGLHMAYYDKNQTVVVMKYLPKGHGWMVLGKSKAHLMPIVDLQFFVDPDGMCSRLFSMSLDRYLIEYDIDRSTEDTGLFIVRVTSIEQTARPTAMVFEGPPELFGIDCITFANSINKIRLFSLEDEKVRKTVSGPVFGRDKGIKRMIAFPTQLTEERFKTFIVYIVKNKLGLMDTPLDGNPHKYMAVYTHPREIIEVAVLSDKERIFTIGKDDNSAFVFGASPKAVEATVLMGGSGITPFYHTIKRHWGGACQDILKDLDMIFFFLNVKRISKQTELYRMNRNIRLCEISAVCRASGFFPSEYEVGLMMDEARRMKMASLAYTDIFATEISFDEFLTLFVNHFYRTTDEDVEEAFKVLGFFEPDQEQPYICKHDFLQYLTTEGEKVSPHNFPIFFDALYDVRTPGEYGDVKCHTVVPEAGTSASSSSSESVVLIKDDGEDTELETGSSGSSSTVSGEDQEDEDEEEQEEQEQENEEVDEGDNDDADDHDARKSYVPKRQQSESEVVPPTEDGENASLTVDEILQDQISPEIEGDIVEELNKPEEELVDLPERVDLMYFLDQMLPTESQQMIRWQTKIDKGSKENEEPTKKQDAKLIKDEKAFLNSILKQIMDPTQPVPRKLLDTLYAEFYLQHGNFSVPPDIRFPGIALPGDNWYNESDHADGTSKTSRSSVNTTGTGEKDEQDEEIETGEDEEEEETEEDEEEDEEEKEEEDNEEEDSEGGDEDEEEEENEQEEENEEGDENEDTDLLANHLLEEEVNDEGEQKPQQEDVTLPSTAVTVDNLDDPATITDEEEGTYSAPFTVSDHPNAVSEGRRGYETDATEEMTDYEHDDLEFVRRMNPATPGRKSEVSEDKKSLR